MAEIREGSLSELIPDDKNMNRHTPYGMSLIEKSIRENGLGRSILVDKDNRIIGGNGVVETAAAVGMENTIVVETTGDKLVVVKRTDVSLDSKQGRSMAMADNATAAADLDWDAEAVNDIVEEWGIEPQDWGVVLDEELPYPDELTADDKDKPFSLTLKTTNIAEFNKLRVQIKQILQDYESVALSITGGEL